jgi:hypothetical protein
VLHWSPEVVHVSFVHGHARATGWVVAHVRRPTRAEEGQLPLSEPDAAADQVDQSGPGVPDPGPAPAPVSSARTSAITRS